MQKPAKSGLLKGIISGVLITFHHVFLLEQLRAQ